MANCLINKLFVLGLSIVITLPLSGCFATKKKPIQTPPATTKRYKMDQDAAPHPKEEIPDISKVTNAVPKHEPKSRYGNPKDYVVFKKRYTVLPSSKGYVARGKASWYGKKFHGYRTSSGEPYDMYGMSAAHKTLPLPTYARVKNLDNGKSIIVKINDRGPFHDERIIDLSYAAASKLGILNRGTGNVEVLALDPGSPDIPVGPKLYLQIGAFSAENNAKQMALKLQKITKNHPIEIRRAHASKSKLYHVHIGPIADETVVSELKVKLKAHKFPTPITRKIH